LQDRNAFAGKFEDLAALGSRGNLQFDFAFQRRNLKLAAERCLGKGNRNLGWSLTVMTT
jgi:hypothetical protein